MNSSTSPSHPTLPSPFTNTAPAPALITQGAEAHLYRTTFLTPDLPAALKVRPSKPYRHPILDARLTKQRVLAEARVLAKLGGLGVGVPGLWGVDWNMDGGGAWLLMEWITGRSVKELLKDCDRLQQGQGSDDGGGGGREVDVRRLMNRVGRAVGVMHSKGGVVHGDLTTSNIMVRPSHKENGYVDGVVSDGETLDLDGEVILIDFGLATQSIHDEDRAVDLYVLERAFGSTHPKQECWFAEEVLESAQGYRGSFKGANVVLKRLEEVRMRGRKRSMVG